MRAKRTRALCCACLLVTIHPTPPSGDADAAVVCAPALAVSALAASARAEAAAVRAESADTRADASTAAADEQDIIEAFEQSFVTTPERRVCRVTAYCDKGVTAAGVPSGVGQCAAPADVPFGSLIYVPDLGRILIATDRTAKRFRGNTVDIYIPDREDCLEFGRQYLECYVYTPIETPSYGSLILYDAIDTFAD